MTNKINDGGPAFPETRDEYKADDGEYRIASSGGMSLRDYFAAKALPIAQSDESQHPTFDGDTSYRGVAVRRTYLYADAMIKARSA